MRTVLITGATGGLGRALALRYWDAGHSLVLMDVNADALNDLAGRFGDASRVHTIVCDLCDDDSIHAAAAQLTAYTSMLDVLINNAGITHRSAASSTRPEVFARVMQVDWLGTVSLTQLLLPQLRHGGKVICIGSMAGWMPVPGRAAYCAAKAALTQFFEVWRLELDQLGIGLLMVYPSFLDTAIERNALGADGAQANHARSTLGSVRSADWMAARILHSDRRQRMRLFPDRLSRLASLLWRVWPKLYLRQVRRRFPEDIQP
ncbi:SDR family NAD(P)-dependent oxidoreductase [Isoalcanivorax beigongshangi]|uniref:SDR family NAD(P)-dependent oxidoreductase n=1 Tax=Isoalcanivorax beigongshangi TaxID=3238810 RepID=A0ABV4AES7_9GAMM